MPEGLPPEGDQPIAGLGPGMPPNPAPDEPPAQEPEPAGPDTAAQLEQLQAAFDQQQEVLQQLAPMAEYLQNAPGPQTQNGEQPLLPPEPWDENYQQKMHEYQKTMLDQALSPYQEQFQKQQFEQDQGRAMDIIADVQAERGELLQPQFEEGQKGLTPNELILARAIELYPQFESQHGRGPRADEAAIEQAYEDVKAHQDALLAAAQARQENQISRLGTAAREPANSGVASPPLTIAPSSWDEFDRRHGIS